MNFSPKKAGESLNKGFNLIRNLAADETIDSVTFSIVVIRGTDASPNSMLSGDPIISGAIVKQKIIGGVSGCYYDIAATVTTSAGNVFIEEATLQVTA